ncbi:class I SAM-dependent methyltransferase [Rhodopirellula sp. JC740]|uniref:Class I SAM-dependent methyltransferase n=1 Tax=Rhodopirellula halodulae TaxID=2894198 RepID=A0ABS8NDK3_9BACT|nr:class I SAM-dependent methyltransferase [Rhodopirellula sp. JC740]MCC9640918.1 class I SAM-dependent methyltransferase [Rhodopirellula sp. JC740]
MFNSRPHSSDSTAEPASLNRGESPARIEQTQWRRPAGVSAGTWRYVHQGSIAHHYDDFVANTPLCELDQKILREVFESIDLPPTGDGQSSSGGDESSEKVFSANDDWILDLGCGTGRAASELASMGRNVLAIDLSQAMLGYVRERATVAAEQNTSTTAGKIVPLRANLVELDCLADNSAAGAVCLFSTLGMIQERENRRAVLRHASRIVRPGGKLLLHVHNRYASLAQAGGKMLLLKSWLKSLISQDHEFGDATYPYRGLPDMFLHRYSRRELQTDLGKSGWSPQTFHRLTLDGAEILSADSQTGNSQTQSTLVGGYIAVAEPT